MKGIQVENKVFKAFINKYGCTKVTIPHAGGTITLRPDNPFYVADVPENKELIRKFARHPFVGMTKDLHAVEVLTYIMNPKNFPSVYKMIHPNSDTAKMNQYKPEEEEVIIANLKKKGYDVRFYSEMNDEILDINEAKKILEKHGYTITKKPNAKPDEQLYQTGPGVIDKPFSLNDRTAKVEDEHRYTKITAYETEKLKAMTRKELNKLGKDYNINTFGMATEELIKKIVYNKMRDKDYKEPDVNLDEILDTVTKRTDDSTEN